MAQSFTFKAIFMNKINLKEQKDVFILLLVHKMTHLVIVFLLFNLKWGGGGGGGQWLC